MWIDIDEREKFSGLTWLRFGCLALLSGVIVGVVALWWDLDKDWFPVLTLVVWATVILVARLLRRPDSN
jgi:hypothetical protein